MSLASNQHSHSSIRKISTESYGGKMKLLGRKKLKICYFCQFQFIKIQMQNKNGWYL